MELVERMFAHSDRFVRPKITSPASRSRATSGASAAATLSLSARAAGGGRLTGDSDIVLEEDGDTMEGAASPVTDNEAYPAPKLVQKHLGSSEIIAFELGTGIIILGHPIRECVHDGLARVFA